MTFVIGFMGMSNFITLIVLYIQSSLITIIENNRYVQFQIMGRMVRVSRIGPFNRDFVRVKVFEFLLGGSSHRIINIHLHSFHVSSDFKLMRCLLKI